MTLPPHWRKMFWIPLVVGLVLDLASKVWAEAAFQPTGWEPGVPTPVHPVINGVLAWKWAGNTGAAFSMLDGRVALLAIVAIAALCGLVYWVYKTPEDDRFTQLALGLIASGAVGNLWDRLMLGYVRDFIYFDFDLPFHQSVTFIPQRYPVFNVADIAILGGAILMLWATRTPAEPTDPPNDRR